MAVQTITYGDKSYLNQNADIPATNKVQDIDMNEIKSVVNNNASETSSNTTNISNITGQVLWTNPNPTNTFTSQSIDLQNSDFDMIQIVFYQANNILRFQTTGTIPIGDSLITTMFNAKSYIRNFSVSNNILTFDDCNTYNSYNSATATVNNNALIPIYIIGYKTGLFN